MPWWVSPFPIQCPELYKNKVSQLNISLQGACIYSLFAYDYDTPSSSLPNSPVMDSVSQINLFFPNLLFEYFITAAEMKLEQSFYLWWYWVSPAHLT